MQLFDDFFVYGVTADLSDNDITEAQLRVLRSKLSTFVRKVREFEEEPEIGKFFKYKMFVLMKRAFDRMNINKLMRASSYSVAREYNFLTVADFPEFELLVENYVEMHKYLHKSCKLRYFKNLAQMTYEIQITLAKHLRHDSSYDEIRVKIIERLDNAIVVRRSKTHAKRL